MKSQRNGVVIAVILVLLAAGSFFATRSWQAASLSYERLPAAEGCDLRAGPCSTNVGQGRLTFSVQPTEIPLMKTLALRVEVSGLDVDGVKVDIRGLNMDMGLNRTVLTQAQNDSWTGETILPLCSQRRMEWEAAIQVDGARRIELPFPFVTAR